MTRPRRIIWFADLEALVDRLDRLEVLQGEIGLTTVAPESHLSHTSGFTASPAIAAASPLRDWRAKPGLKDHHDVFGVPEPAMAVLPGIVGGVDDGPLLRVIDECRRLGLEVWGHAGVWSYGAEVFPEFAAVDLWGRPLVPDSLRWGTMFCPSKDVLNQWIGASLADAATRYDLDGWFLDHARYTTPAHGPTLFACACADCASAAQERGVDLADVRLEFERLFDDLRDAGPDRLLSLAGSGPVGLAGWLAARPAVRGWFEVRARILAARFGELAEAVRAASPRPVDFGCDVFPPGVALLGGHLYDAWSAAGASYLTGGFTPNIWWGSVGRITAESLGARLESLVPDTSASFAAGIVVTLLGAPSDQTAERDLDAYLTELRRMEVARGELPVYPPVPGPPDPETLGRMCRGIADAGLDGAMLAGLEAASDEQLRAIRTNLSVPLQ